MEGSLLLLAGDEDPKKPYQRVPLLHKGAGGRFRAGPRSAG